MGSKSNFKQVISQPPFNIPMVCSYGYQQRIKTNLILDFFFFFGAEKGYFRAVVSSYVDLTMF